MASRSGLISSLSEEIPLRGGVSTEGVGGISEWIYERLGVLSVFKPHIIKAIIGWPFLLQ